ncbi:MAG: hypothetical protein WKG07_10595 [Hymenobacter sp.]
MGGFVFVAGLVLGLGLLDKSLRTPAAAAKQTGLPVAGVLLDVHATPQAAASFAAAQPGPAGAAHSAASQHAAYGVALRGGHLQRAASGKQDDALPGASRSAATRWACKRWPSTPTPTIPAKCWKLRRSSIRPK